MTLDNSAQIELTNQKQREAADPYVSAWASANAGAGKTKVLIDRIARLLLTGVSPDKILAVTYTKAAAAEMTTRLFQTLGDWTVAQDDALREKLRHLDPNLEIDTGLLSNARRLFARALETPGGLKIQTIHAFCQTILKRFPIEAGVAPGFEVIDDVAASDLKARAYEAAARELPDDFAFIAGQTSLEGNRELIAIAGQKLGPDFDKAQLIADLEARFGWDRQIELDAIIANAIAVFDYGFVKQCADALVEIGGKNNIKAANKLFEIVAASYDTRFDLWCNLILTKGELRASSPIDKKANSHEDLEALFGPYSGRGEGWQLSESLREFYDLAEKHEIAKICEATISLNCAAAMWQNHYQALKSASGKLDFGDLIKATANLFGMGKNASLWVIYKLDQGISHILIDESQDTSAEQWNLIKPLFVAMDDAVQSGAYNGTRSQFIVGDEKQSIYSFQGASPERFLAERSDFSASIEGDFAPANQQEHKNIIFDVSFRSGKKILEAVDQVWHLTADADVAAKAQQHLENAAKAKKSESEFELEFKFQAPTSHFSARADQKTSFELWPLELGSKSDDETPEYWEHPKDINLDASPINQLAEQIVKEIGRRIGNKVQVWNKSGTTRNVQAKDFMILVKQRKQLFHQIIRRLKANKIPVAGSDLIVLNQEMSIIDILTLGQFLLRPEDDFNLACVLKGVFCGLISDDEHLFPLAYERGNASLWQRLEANPSPIFAPAKKFLQDIIENCQGISPFDFISYVLERKHQDGEIGWDKIYLRFGIEAREPIEVLLDLAIQADQMGIGNLHAFLDYIENHASEVKRDFDGENDGVQVMTVHGAKGREAPIVILPDTTRALPTSKNNLIFDKDFGVYIWHIDKCIELEALATQREAAKQDARREDQRLLYVAMTRARDNLILCGHKFGSGKSNYAKDCWYQRFELALPNISDAHEFKLADANGFSARQAKIWGEVPDMSHNEAKIETSKINIEIPTWVYAIPKPFDPPPKRIAPSALVGDDGPSVLSPAIGDNRQRYLRGRLIHELLQTLPNIEPNFRAEWAKRKLSREPSIDDGTRQEIAASTLRIVSDPQFIEIFSTNSRAEVAIIGKGIGLPDDFIINGTIDRLVITDNEILVLDFKTNRPPPAEIEGASQTYINQMAAYRAVLQAAYKGKNVRCALLWTDTPILMEIPQEALDNALCLISKTQSA
ncbi:MAG: addA [Hyphomonadaceae bacterium]|nr:MAG: addA [Hyphomonadaceae bacterium]KAF0186994.1 MAG: addA [Hyphomonadaceae bacterium]